MKRDVFRKKKNSQGGKAPCLSSLARYLALFESMYIGQTPNLLVKTKGTMAVSKMTGLQFGLSNCNYLLFQKNNKRKTNPFQRAHQNPLTISTTNQRGLADPRKHGHTNKQQTQFVLQRLSIETNLQMTPMLELKSRDLNVAIIITSRKLIILLQRTKKAINLKREIESVLWGQCGNSIAEN